MIIIHKATDQNQSVIFFYSMSFLNKKSGPNRRVAGSTLAINVIKPN